MVRDVIAPQRNIVEAGRVCASPEGSVNTLLTCRSSLHAGELELMGAVTATKWAGAISCHAGSSVRHTSIAYGQRALK
jgi:hypothetical protein